MKKVVIWDWNGTLLDDVDLCIETINRLLVSEGIPPFESKEAYQRTFQFPIVSYYEKAGFDFQKTPFTELAKRYMAYYQPKSLQCPLHKGSEAVLKRLQDHGIRQFLLSASQLDFLYEQVRQYDILPYFEDLLGLDNIHAHSKKELAKQCVLQHGWQCDDVVFIGDSVHDHETAAYAGCECILIANGHEHKEKLLLCGSSVVSSIQEAADLIMKDDL